MTTSLPNLTLLGLGTLASSLTLTVLVEQVG
jgi:hypothetical protein